MASGTGSGGAEPTDREVRDWQEKLTAREPGSSQAKLRHLMHFSETTRTPPGRLHRMASHEVHRLVQEFVAAEKQAGRAADQVKASLEVVKLWLEDHGWQLAEWPEWV
jgi:hypothetical protein